MSTRLAVYPGSFDPMTLGHVNIIERSLVQFDEVLVAILNNPSKTGMFTTHERADLIRSIFDGNDRLKVEVFDGLLVDFARDRGACAVVRGLRAVQDFEYEFQMTMMNRRLAPELDTLFMMTDAEHFYIASRLVKEVARFGGDFAGLVPDVVAEAMRAKLAEEADR
jgi:pantetheine-phosphate adenylyltransferase